MSVLGTNCVQLVNTGVSGEREKEQYTFISELNACFCHINLSLLRRTRQRELHVHVFAVVIVSCYPASPGLVKFKF